MDRISKQLLASIGLLALGLLMLWSIDRKIAPTYAQGTTTNAPDCIIGPITTGTTGRQVIFDNRFAGCAIWTLYEFTNGSLAPAVTVQFERSDDNGSGQPLAFAAWPAPDIENTALGAITTLRNLDFNEGQLTFYRWYPWVAVNITQLAAGNITFQVLGYRPKFGTPTTSAAGAAGNDVCSNPGVLVSNVINVTTATTTAIVPVAGNSVVYGCGGEITIASSLTTADTAQFEYGTGAACAAPTKVLTGLLGAGIITAAAGTFGIVVPLPKFQPSAFANGLCMISAGTTINIQGHYNTVSQ